MEQNTIIATFGNTKQRFFTENWVYHVQQLRIGGVLIGVMNTEPDDPLYQSFAASLRARGVGVYTVNSPQVKLNPQGGRWFHVLPLLRTGVRLILSDSDVVWLRDPRPYMVRLERAHPKMDFSISTDSQVMTDARRLASEAGAMAVKSLDAFADARSTLNGSDFDIEGYSLCGVLDEHRDYALSAGPARG